MHHGVTIKIDLLPYNNIFHIQSIFFYNKVSSLVKNVPSAADCCDISEKSRDSMINKIDNS